MLAPDANAAAMPSSDAVFALPQSSTIPKSRIALEKLPSRKYFTAPSVLRLSRLANPASR